MDSRVINCRGIGNIKFRRDRRSRKIRITVRSRHDITVTMPVTLPFAVAETFVTEKSDWIIRSLDRLDEQAGFRELFHENSRFSTRSHELLVSKSEQAKSTVRIVKSKIHVKYDCTKDVSDPEIQKFIITAIESALRKEAKTYLPGRVEELANKFGLKFKRVFLKNAKTRWGSCSSEGNVNLNIHLMRLPDRFIDYVILHELAHTVEMNHSPRFWKLLDSFLGEDSKKIRKEMKAYRTTF